LTTPADTSYQTAPGVVVKSWDEELAVAYAPLQAKTHLVSGAGALILEAASHADVSLSSLLLMEAAEDYRSDADAPESETGRHLQQILDGLLAAGLLHRET
jgi:hypothetical protein